MKKKVSLQEKLRREKQSRRTRGLSPTFWDESGDTFTMTKVGRGAYQLN